MASVPDVCGGIERLVLCSLSVDLFVRGDLLLHVWNTPNEVSSLRLFDVANDAESFNLISASRTSDVDLYLHGQYHVLSIEWVDLRSYLNWSWLPQTDIQVS